MPKLDIGSLIVGIAALLFAVVIGIVYFFIGGKSGPTGNQGPQGNQGRSGQSRGVQGPQGLDGVQGNQGNQGAQGVPANAEIGNFAFNSINSPQIFDSLELQPNTVYNFESTNFVGFSSKTLNVTFDPTVFTVGAMAVININLMEGSSRCTLQAPNNNFYIQTNSAKEASNNGAIWSPFRFNADGGGWLGHSLRFVRLADLDKDRRAVAFDYSKIWTTSSRG